MGVTNVACPHCGRETLVTLPDSGRLQGVSRDYRTGWSIESSAAACSNCGESFWVIYKK